MASNPKKRRTTPLIVFASRTDNTRRVAEAMAAVAFEDGRLEVRITDEMARIQVNALVDFPQSRQFNPQQQQIMERLIDQAARETGIDPVTAMTAHAAVMPARPKRRRSLRSIRCGEFGSR